jgi:hypothetical protein
LKDNGSFAGMFWFAGWLFTIGYARPAWWEDIVAIVIWPYYLGSSLM